MKILTRSEMLGQVIHIYSALLDDASFPKNLEIYIPLNSV